MFLPSTKVLLPNHFSYCNFYVMEILQVIFHWMLAPRLHKVCVEILTSVNTHLSASLLSSSQSGGKLHFAWIHGVDQVLQSRKRKDYQKSPRVSNWSACLAFNVINQKTLFMSSSHYAHQKYIFWQNDYSDMKMCHFQIHHKMFINRK